MLVLDVGNVLVHWDPRRLYQQWMAPDEMEHFLATVCTPAFNHALDAGTAWADIAPGLIERFPHYRADIRAYRERHLEMYAGPVAGMTELVAAARAVGPVWGLTNFSAETWPEVRGHFSLLQQLDGVVVSGQEGVAKPDAEIYQHLEARTGCSAEALFFVDDREANVAAARARGWRGVRFVDASTLAGQLSLQEL